ncbi:hypothetical protein EG832_13130 [bacterium]|nr:hypothetical protein [bacterium]
MAGLTLFYAFLQVLPRHKVILRWAAVLFVVFPGFADQSASVSFGSHFLIYSVFGLSLLTLIWAVKNPNKFWIFYPLSLLLTAAHLFSMEYFVGLELLRPILIYWILIDNGQNEQKSIQKTAIYWLPFLAVLSFYIYWRMAIYQSPVTSSVNSNYPYLITNFLKAPADTLVAFIQTVYSDLRFLLVDIWMNRVLPVALEVKSLTLWLSLVVGVGGTFCLHYFLRGDPTTDGFILKIKEIKRNLLLSVVILFVGLFPA